MEAPPGFEPGVKVLQTSALPLGYVATYGRGEPGVWVCLLARVEGFEPSNDGIRIRCLTAWLYPNVREMGWAMGFEPTHAGATTLCLDHLTTPTRLLKKNGDPDRARTDDLQRDRLAF